MLGKKVPYITAPFFWTRFFNKSFSFTGFHHKYNEVVMKDPLDQKGNFLAVYCQDDLCFGASGVGKSHELIMLNQAIRLGIPIRKSELKEKEYFQNLKKEIMKNKKNCACQRQNINNQ